MADIDLEASLTGGSQVQAGVSLAFSLASGVTGGVTLSGPLGKGMLLGSSVSGGSVVGATMFDSDGLSAIITGQATFTAVSIEIYRPPPRNRPIPLPQPVTVRIVPYTPDPPQASINTRPLSGRQRFQ